ncbi:hypothetical protein QP185_07565 [Sphingomonas aerolata]|uniref:hypothetical protein n=1 Tax=Sphingomonas aerolata TaxID=185951 RepID=UPI002FE355B9
MNFCEISPIEEQPAGYESALALLSPPVHIRTMGIFGAFGRSLWRQSLPLTPRQTGGCRMKLRDSLPLETILARYPEAREEVLADTVAALRANLVDRIPPVGLFVWDEMAFCGDTKKPDRMQKVYPYHSERMFPFVTKELGRVPISDAYYAEWFNGLSDDKPFIKIELCQCYPNDIHIADVVFADLSRPARDRSEVAPDLTVAWASSTSFLTGCAASPVIAGSSAFH